MRILNLGSMNLDYVYGVESMVKAGETIRALSRRVCCGGKGLNQSIALEGRSSGLAGRSAWRGRRSAALDS